MLKPKIQGRDNTIIAGQVADAGNQIFKHCNDRGHGGKGHEQEKQGTPELSARHMIEYIGQRDEQQVGSCTRIHVKCRAGREDDQTAHDGYKGIQQNYADGFAGKP